MLAGMLCLALLGLILFTRWCFQASLERCADVVAQDLLKHRPDIVIGSSWGGRVVLRVMERGLWSGNTLLLCPAVAASDCLGRVALPLYRPSLDAQSADQGSLWLSKKVCVVQGTDDETVPYQAVSALCHRWRIPLVTLSGADHRLNAALLKTDRLKGLVMEVVRGEHTRQGNKGSKHRRTG